MTKPRKLPDTCLSDVRGHTVILMGHTSGHARSHLIELGADVEVDDETLHHFCVGLVSGVVGDPDQILDNKPEPNARGRQPGERYAKKTDQGLIVISTRFTTAEEETRPPPKMHPVGTRQVTTIHPRPAGLRGRVLWQKKV